MPNTEFPVMWENQFVTDQWTALPSFLPVPGFGVLAVNSFLLKGKEPLLVDTGIAALGEDHLAQLENEIDLDDLRWIWLSHTDADHVGNLSRVLARAPNAKVVTNFLGMGKMQLLGLDVSRVHLIEPGAEFDVGDRRLAPVRPPYYDAPETMGFLDTKAGVFFAADSFGALLPEPAADIDCINGSALREGMVTWSSIDAPWLATADRSSFGRTLRALERIGPKTLLSGHLPVARDGVSRLTAIVHDAWCKGPTNSIDPLAIERLASVLD